MDQARCKWPNNCKGEFNDPNSHEAQKRSYLYDVPIFLSKITYNCPHLKELAVPKVFSGFVGKENCQPLHEYAKPISVESVGASVGKILEAM